MNEFSLIQRYFKSIPHSRRDVLFGIGDDAACLQVPSDMDLLVSTDTLVAGVHFLMDWDAYDIAVRSVNVNVSDMVAMAATPCWVSLALTMPTLDESWLQRFSRGLSDALCAHHMALVGGDTTRGPMSITLTIHGFAPKGRAIRRCGAQIGDAILVSGPLGAASMAVTPFVQAVNDKDQLVLMDKLLRPNPRVDLIETLRFHASAAIDISDGFCADLHHILEASQVGACVMLEHVPVHPLVQQHQPDRAMDFALWGGDDYEICFTVPPSSAHFFPDCYVVGVIERELGLRGQIRQGPIEELSSQGYSHF